MRTLLFKLLLFAIPIVVITLAAALSPFDTFYFRHWEAMSARTKGVLLPGPFYPLQKSVMTEEGDLGHGTPFALKRKVVWETDRYGFRKHDTAEPADVVVIGDSLAAGCGLTQDDIFTEVLQRKLGCKVYPYAPANINAFVQDPRFKATPPKVVILEIIERDMLRLEKIVQKPSVPSMIREEMKSFAATSPAYPRRAAIIVDRMTKIEAFNFLKSRLLPEPLGTRYNGIFFYQGAAARRDATSSEIAETVSALRQYNDYFKQRNISFIFMPVPNKETVYPDYLPGAPDFGGLGKVLKAAEDAGVPTINVLAGFKACRQDGGNPYLVDDTHWNKGGVEVAAEFAARTISSLPRPWRIVATQSLRSPPSLGKSTTE